MQVPPTESGALEGRGERPSPIDRPVMWQTWSHLLFLHWEVPTTAIRDLVPWELEIDRYRGSAFVGLVPFSMSDIRPIWAPPVPGLSAFHEVNVRTYVRHPERGPGVWFFSLDAANGIAVMLARRLWHLPYFHARMAVVRRPTGPDTSEITYRSVRRSRQGPAASCLIRYTSGGAPAPAIPGTLEHFLVERYALYCQGGGRLWRGSVHHEPYPLEDADVHGLEETLIEAAGIVRPIAAPLAHYARTVRVKIGRLETVGTAKSNRGGSR